jgi:carotenoid cleavage dioxygenase
MTNRYLEDNFAPVREELTVADLPVTGRLPDHLDGRYLRIGPNPVDEVGENHHWFLGDGMVHGVRIADGEAKWYRNRFVRSDHVAKRLGEPSRSPGWDNLDFAANTHVREHAGQTLALVEGGSSPYLLTEDLDTVGPTDFDGTLRTGSLPAGYSAHPHEDPATGELHAVSYNWLRGNRVDYTVRGTDGRIRRTVPVEVGGSPMMHDFALTENYVVLYDLPVVFDKRRALEGMPRAMRLPARLMMSALIGRNPLPDPVIARIARGCRTEAPMATLPYSWDDSYPARLGLLPRNGESKDVRWFEIDPCFVFHTLNAYEDDGSVVIDVVRHDRMFATVLNGPDEGPPTLARFTVDLSANKVREDRFDDHAQEFPRIDERNTGRRHRFGYSIGFRDGEPGDAVLRHDLAAGSTVVRKLGAGREASEFCFVAGDGSTDEADGVLMGYVFDRERGSSDLVMLDAETLEDVATVHLPARVPAGFHGSWNPRSVAEAAD